MAEFASPQEIQRALEILLDLQSEDPNKLDGILHKYANPFTSWPLLAEPTRVFLSFFETPAQTVETGENQQNINPKIKELVEEFDRELAAAKEHRVDAATATKKFVESLKENAKKSNAPLPETQAPAPPVQEGVPVSPERIQSIINAAIRYPGPPEEKTLVFHALTSFASEQPAQSITDLIPRAIAVTEATRVIVSPEEIVPKEALFSPRAAGVFQQLGTIVNHPELIPKTTLADMTARWGENFVNSPWFTKLQGDANRMIADQKTAATIVGKVSSLFSDVTTAVLRGPIDQNVIAYIETYRLVAAEGIPMTNPSRFGGIALGYGGQLVRAGGSYVIRTGAKAVMKKAAISGATKLGIEVATGAATGGLGWAAMAATGALGWLKDRGVALLRSVFFMGSGKNPEDNLILVVGAGVLLVFFLPIFPLLNLPAFNQSMIDTSIATASTGGEDAEQGSQYLQLSKSASPPSFPNNNASSVTYTITVLPTNPNDAVVVTDIRDSLVVYVGGNATPTIAPPTITPDNVAGGKPFSYTIQLGPQFHDAMIINTVTVVANVGSHTGETKSVSSNVLIGNPPTGCFAFGDAGVPDAYGHVSSAWDNRSGVLAAIAMIGKSPSYMALACAGGKTITLYRVKANFGGGSVNSASAIFLYNAGITGQSAAYTMAHEMGHIIARRTSLYSQYNSEALYKREGPIWTYPNAYSPGEDFAETLGVYVVYKSYVFRRKGARLDYPREYPLHYQFARGIFGVEY